MIKNLIYRFVSYVIVFPIYRILFRGVTFGNTNVPKNCPLIVVANHGSHLDPPLLGHVLGRQVGFMAKAELFRVPLLGPLIEACGAYSVERGSSDREAIKIALARLNKGDVIGIFLDGTRQSNGRVNNPLPGAAFLAARSRAFLLPVGIVNSHRALKPGKYLPNFLPIHIRIGEPIAPPKSRKKEDIKETTLLLKQKINLLS